MLTDLSFLETGKPWPPPTERERIDRYIKNVRLWRGYHQDVLTGWDRLLASDYRYQQVVEIVLNWHKRLSTLWGDLVVGKPPRFLAASLDQAQQGVVPLSTPEQDQIDDIVRRNKLPRVAYETVIDASRFGDSIMRARRTANGLSVIEALPPEGWFPVVDPENLREVVAHVITWKIQVPLPGASTGNYSQLIGLAGNIGGSRNSQTKEILRVEIHALGGVINRAFELEGSKLGPELSVADVTGGVRQVEEKTGVDDAFLVVPVCPMRTTDSLYGIDDYTDLESVIHEMEIRMSQNSRILDKHADPSMAGPESILDQDVRTGRTRIEAGKFFPVAEGEEHPAYITWNGNLEASFKQIDKLVEMLYVVSETSPAAFGKLDTGLAQSGSSMKRLLMAPLLKAQRIQGALDPALTEMMTLAMRLEGKAMPQPVRIEWQDGLPKDFVEMANAEAVRVGAGLSSVRSSLRRLDDASEAELDGEMQQIKSDAELKIQQAAELAKLGTPPGGGPGGGGGGGEGSLPGEKFPGLTRSPPSAFKD